MMNHATRNRLFLLVAFFHLLADVAFAGGAVLCVGPDDHRAIESQYVADSGCVSDQPVSTRGTDLSANTSDAGECTDSPLHSEAELTSSAESVSDAESSPVAFSTPSMLADVAAVRLRACARAPTGSPGLRHHRTIVLII